MEIKEIYIVEAQSQYDGGHSVAVFSTIEKARTFIESQKDFNGWEDDKKETSKPNMEFDFYYTIEEMELDKS